MGHDLIPEGMLLVEVTQHGIIAAGIDLVEVGITFAHNGLPDQQLGGDGVGQLVSVGGVLGTPVQADITGIAVLEDPTDEQLDLVRGEHIVVVGGVVVPEVFALLLELVAGILGDTGLDAVADLGRVGADGTDVGVPAPGGMPAVLEGQGTVAPVIVIGTVALTGEGDHKDFVRHIRGGVGGDAKTGESGEADDECQQQGGGSLEDGRFH